MFQSCNKPMGLFSVRRMSWATVCGFETWLKVLTLPVWEVQTRKAETMKKEIVLGAGGK